MSGAVEIPAGARNNVVQVFRAIAVIAVVMIHTTPIGVCEVYCRPLINFAVATFLFLSGYLTKVENENWMSFFKKRILRVLVPYLIWSIIYTLVNEPNQGLSVLGNNLLLGDAAIHLYYILVYVQFVLLTPLMGRLAQSRYHWLGWLIAPVTCLFFRYSWLLPGYHPGVMVAHISLLWENSFVAWFTFYYLGLLLGNRIMEKRYSLKGLTLWYVLSLVLQMAESYGWQQAGIMKFATQLKLTSLLSSSLFLLIVYTVLQGKARAVNCRLMVMLGDYSFGIYLSHILIMKLLEQVPYYSAVPYPVTSAIVVVISFMGCYLGYRLCGPRLGKHLGLR